MFKVRRSEKPDKTRCIHCKEPFDKQTNPYKLCAVCQDFRYCKACLVKCAQCPEELECFLCPSFHPHECVWPECGKSLCQMHGMNNPLSFCVHDKRICICDEHKEKVVKRMREEVDFETLHSLQPRKRLQNSEEKE